MFKPRWMAYPLESAPFAFRKLNMIRSLIFLFFFVALSLPTWEQTSLSESSWGDELSDLKTWLAGPSESRGELSQQAFAKKALSKSQAKEATTLLLENFQKRIRSQRAEEWKAKKIELGEMSMKFEYKIFGEKPMGGRSLFISMHGGGGAPARVNDQQWRNQVRLYEPKEGVYLAPRAPTNTWNLWHQSHIDRFFQRIIEDAIVFEDVNPNKVYIMGYSAGGDGVYQLAPRMADSLAAAAMMAGHPNDASPLGLRNIGFTLHMGGKDSAYSRNEVARQWKKKLADLKAKDPEGYEHEVVIHEKYGHWMNRDDKIAVPWMAKFTRDPNPSKIVWRQASTTHGRFYWLAADKDQQKNGSVVVAERDQQNIKLTKMDKVSKIRIRLNDDLCDLDKKVVVTTPDGRSETYQPQRTIQTIYRCLDERVDPSAIYSAELEVSIAE